MSDTAVWVHRSRLRKAHKLVDMLERAGINAVPTDDAGRRATEELAGVPLSSDDTWALVDELLTSRQEATAYRRLLHEAYDALRHDQRHAALTSRILSALTS